MIGAARLGRTSRNRIRRVPAPIERADSMNSLLRIVSTCPRTIRPMYGHVKSAMIPVTSDTPGSTSPPRHPSAVIEQVAAIPIENSSTGREKTEGGMLGGGGGGAET